MVLLADDDEERLRPAVAEVRASAAGRVRRAHDRARRAPDADLPAPGELTIEHFGFQDGVSQPLMIKQDVDAEIGPAGAASLEPAGAAVVGAAARAGRRIRQLPRLPQARAGRQGVLGRARDLANRTGVDVEDPRRDGRGAHRGRYPAGADGPPVDPGADPNDFHYDLDPVGRQCPLHAHIRKTNPRGDVPRYIRPRTEELRASPPNRAGAASPTASGPTSPTRPAVGRPHGRRVCCSCASRRNLDQFVIQQDGSDSNHFVRSNVGVDAVIGQHPDRSPSGGPAAWRSRWPTS